MSRVAPNLPAADARRGFLLGVLGVTIFAMTLPMTRLAVGDAANPQLAPAFVTAGRAAVAGLCSVAYLLLLGIPRPARRHWPALAVSGLGTVVGFPLFLALALRRVDAVHAAVVTGFLPLGTAVAAAISLRQRPSNAFWICALLGCALVLGYAAWAGGGSLSTGDGLLLLAVASASVAYVAGARVAAVLPAEHVICWILAAALPLTLPAALWVAPGAGARASAWVGFGYVSLFSMWLGFFAWYRGLALGGVVRVSQVQLLQPFLALLFAVPVLGERLDPVSMIFALAVMAVVFIGRKLPATRSHS